MGRIAVWIRAVALTLGAPGLFLVSLLDSSFLSLPEVVDLLVVWMVTRNHGRMWLYVLGATLGSLGGCLVLYAIGRRGGDALVRRRFAGATVERTMATFQRHGVLAVLVPAILPPPAPFKVFVILAGVARISVAKFTMAVVMGRGMRYLILGVLAIAYGDRALAYAQEHAVAVSLAVVALLVVGLVAYLLWNRAQRARGRVHLVS